MVSRTRLRGNTVYHWNPCRTISVLTNHKRKTWHPCDQSTTIIMRTPFPAPSACSFRLLPLLSPSASLFASGPVRALRVLKLYNNSSDNGSNNNYNKVHNDGSSLPNVGQLTHWQTTEPLRHLLTSRHPLTGLLRVLLVCVHRPGGSCTQTPRLRVGNITLVCVDVPTPDETAIACTACTRSSSICVRKHMYVVPRHSRDQGH